MRALLSLLMLAGFFLVALVELVAAFVGVILLLDGSHIPAGYHLLKPVVLLIFGGVGLGLWRAVKAKDVPPNGVRVSQADAPELWATVRELAAEVRTRAPKEIVLIADVNAAVHEQTRLLGLIGGKRTLAIGVPLLLGLRVDQMRAVLAHELGHYSGRHTRLAGSAYRGRLAIGTALGGVSNANVAAWPLKLYARLYLLVDNAVSRRQELEADRASVRLAGRDAAASALRELPVLDAAYGFYLGAYVEAGWSAGHTPDDLFAGFAALLEARRDELEDLRAEEPDGEGSRWDTHPPIGRRIETIMASPEDGRPADARPAQLLLADPAAVRQRAQQNLINAAGRTPLPWPDFTNAALTSLRQADADRAFRAIARSTGLARPGLGDVLELIAAGRLADFAQPLFPDATRKELPGETVPLLAGLMELAALNSGVLRFVHSWSGPAVLAAVDGELDLRPVAELAVSDPAAARLRLTELGVRVESAAVHAVTAPVAGAELIGGIANVKVDGNDHDLLILTTGLILVAGAGSTGKGEKRLRELIEDSSPESLAARYGYLPYEELVDAEVHREIPVKATLVRHDGRRVELAERLTSETLTKKSQEALTTMLKRVHLAN
ncbi:hypothetical protein GCM10027589_29240 [Actinocorallia lasiicapitis]